MSLSLLWMGTALAGGTALWLEGPEDPAVTPGQQIVTPADIAQSAHWTEADARAIAHLSAELAAVGPLKDEFDGELQIMRRLETALSDVAVLREEDRETAFAALLFQGYAVHRTFQQALASDPKAEPWRVRAGNQTEVRAWVQAVALHPDGEATAALIPDEPQRLAFQETRARLLLRPPATIEAQHLPSDARLVVNGLPAATHVAKVLPGEHRVVLQGPDGIRARASLQLGSEDQAVLTWTAGMADLAALADELRSGPPGAVLSGAVVASLDPLDAPLTLALPSKRGALVYEVSGNAASLVVAPAKGPSQGSEARVSMGAAAGLGWFYDGDFLLQNLPDGAPATQGTVNALAPTAHLGTDLVLGPFAVGIGLDGQLPTGEFHDLPVGDSRLRLRAFPHLRLGIPEAGLAVGALLPWHLGVGPRLNIPLAGDGALELTGAGTLGIGLEQARGGDAPSFSPSQAWTGWLGLGTRFDIGG